MPLNLMLTRHNKIALTSLSRVLGGIAVVVGLLALLGWQFNIAIFQSADPSLVPVNPLVAVLFIASGVSAFMLNDGGNSKKLHWVAKVLAAFVLGIASLEAFIIFGLGDVGLDKVLFRQQVLAVGNQMAPVASINFVLVGLALLVRDFKGQFLRNPAHLLILLSLFLVMQSLLGYLYGVIYLYEIVHARYYPIDLYTAINFLFLNISILLMRPKEELIKLIFNRGPAGIMMRGLLPVVLITTILIGWMKFYLQQAGILNYELLVTMTVTAFFFITSIVIWWNSRSIFHLDEQRKIVSDQVRHQRSLLQSVISSIGEAIIVVDQEYKVLVTNEMAAKLIDMDQHEMIGRDLRECISFVNNDKSLSLEQKLDSIVPKFGHMLVIDLRDNVSLKTIKGKILPISGVIAPLKGGESIKGLVASLRDISADKEIDIAKTEFVSLASHQLRTPLSTINWYTEVLKGGDVGPVSPQQSEYLDEIIRANKRMIDLVNSLLSVSRIELGVFSSVSQEVNVVEIARIVLDELRAGITGKKLVIEENYGDEIPFVMVDANYIKIIIQNIISNAVNYSFKGGKIGVSIGKDNHGLLLKVSDNGCGIPEADKSKIFLKLFRAENTRSSDVEGTGLGLYLVKLILDKSGGKIWFESKENHGTTFYVSLPNQFLNNTTHKQQN